jgi:dipeptidyl aminopeptidase/acylaminoacyl peptidase
MRRPILLLSFVVMVAVCFSANLSAEKLDYLDKLPPMIERDVFFGNPEIAGGQISPDGKYISFIKPYRDVLNIWVKKREEPYQDARPMTADTTRPVTGYYWTYDSKYIIYIQDKGGNENYHAYAVNPYAEPAEGKDVPTARDLTPIEGIRVLFYGTFKNEPDIIYIGLNDRDERYHDLYQLRVSTGERNLIRENKENISSWRFDQEGNLRLATRTTDDGGTEILKTEGDKLVQVYECSNEEQVGILRFHKDGKRVYLDTNKGEDVNLSRLVLFNPETLEEEFVEADPKGEVDFGGAEFSSKNDELIATYYLGDRLRIYFKDKKFEKAYKKLQKELPDGDIYMGSSTLDDRLWMVAVTKDTDPGARYLFDMKTGDVEFQYRPRPELPTEHLSRMKTIQYQARDGLTIHGYLTLPKGVKPENLPVVVHPHGGPWARDRWGYNPYAQFLANRGYAVFQMNFRGSAGYGKAFLNAGKKQWGDAMQDDITDGVKYLIEEGIADPDKIAIFGGSYGGYATLAGLAFTPDLYNCGVDYVGVSNLLTFLESIPPYWETLRKFLDEHVGSLENPEDLERLKRQSPLFSADKIKAPLLVVQGANDPRVKKAESDQIVTAMRDLGREVEYIIAPDEGHGFANEDNRMAMVTAMEDFFADHLGGRYQKSIQDEVEKRLDQITVDVSTVKVEKPEVDPEKAMKLPLPEIDSGKIKPTSLTYKANMQIAGQEIDIGISRNVEESKFDGKDVWRIVSQQETPMGSAMDTVFLDKSTILPIRRTINQQQVRVVMDYGDQAVTGKIHMGTNEIPINIDLPAPTLSDGASQELAIVGMPLAEGFETTFRVFNVQAQKVRPMLLKVTGSETVEVAAGSFESFKIEIKPLDGDPGGGTMFVSKKDPRYMVRGTFQLPAQAGGGSMTVELESYK